METLEILVADGEKKNLSSSEIVRPAGHADVGWPVNKKGKKKEEEGGVKGCEYSFSIPLAVLFMLTECDYKADKKEGKKGG